MLIRYIPLSGGTESTIDISSSELDMYMKTCYVTSITLIDGFDSASTLEQLAQYDLTNFWYIGCINFSHNDLDKTHDALDFINLRFPNIKFNFESVYGNYEL